MNRITGGKLKRSVKCTFTLLLAVLTLAGNVPALNHGGTNADSGMNALVTNDAVKYEDYMRDLYGDDWEEVGALQPGDSYISGDIMYLCHEDTYVQWKRIKSVVDLMGENWGSERLLLLTSPDGEDLYIGNDYAKQMVDGDYKGSLQLRASSPNDVRLELDMDSAEHVETYCYPELQQYLAESTGGYPYPESFRTGSTLNAPYIRYVGKDKDNGNSPMFKIILSRDDGEISSVALGLDEDKKALELEAVEKSDNFTFRMNLDVANKRSFLDIFANVEDEDDVWLVYDLFGNFGSLKGEVTFKQEVYPAYLGRKHQTKRIEVISLNPEAAQNPEALENVYGGAIEFYRWQRITNTVDTSSMTNLQKNIEPGARMLLVWDDKYFLAGDDFRLKDDGEGMALYVNEATGDSAAPGNIAEYPEITNEVLTKGEEFYTATGLGTPYIYHQMKDTNANNDYCEYFTIQLAGADDNPSGKWLCDAENVLGVCRQEDGSDLSAKMHKTITEEHRVGFIFGKELASKNDAKEGYCKLFFNDNNGYDTALYHSGNVLYGSDDGSGWNYGQFKMFIGHKVTYPAVRQDYIVGEDQFMHISQNGAMLKETTIVVRKGGVLSIESWFMNNGRIIVDGGTLIVQDGENPLGNEIEDDTEDSVMMPYLDIHPTVSGYLELRNGGELIVMDGARAAFSTVKASGGSSIFNNGTLLAETITMQDSTLENRKGMNVFAGYYFRPMSTFRNSSLSLVIKDLSTRLHEDIPSIYQEKNSCILNHGTIRYSTSRRFVSVTATLEGSGEMQQVRGKVIK